jgi:hypothetical protein
MPESPPVFGSVLGARVGVAAPVVVLDVAAAVAPVVVAAAVAPVVVAAAVAPVVVAAAVPTAVPVPACSAGAAPLLAPTRGTNIRLNTITAATATITARDVLRIPSSLCSTSARQNTRLCYTVSLSSAAGRLQVPCQAICFIGMAWLNMLRPRATETSVQPALTRGLDGSLRRQ